MRRAVSRGWIGYCQGHASNQSRVSFPINLSILLILSDFLMQAKELTMLYGSKGNLLTAHLDEALEGSLCPICALAADTERRHLDLLLY